jgi:hypothetical protein
MKAALAIVAAAAAAAAANSRDRPRGGDFIDVGKEVFLGSC